ncbi:hypothetical protein MLD38_001558 [Melastoma candidum]|uniref:Uncharacterized protein n=1 Tax=Melastoma candidum TaxID=119954 RepID=A0ACB9SFL1_9MYRT|nr:hypothetical protein MLD38_001558 [Melastoma candidum]
MPKEGEHCVDARSEGNDWLWPLLVSEVIGGKDRTGLEASRSREMYFPEGVYKHLHSGKALLMSEINSPEDEEIVRNMMLVSLWRIQRNPSDVKGLRHYTTP